MCYEVVRINNSLLIESRGCCTYSSLCSFTLGFSRNLSASHHSLMRHWAAIRNSTPVLSALFPLVQSLKINPSGNCTCYTVYIGLLWGSLGAVQWGSHLGSVSSVSSVMLEGGWLDQVAVPDLWYQSPAAASATVCCVAFLSSLLFSSLSFPCTIIHPLFFSNLFYRPIVDTQTVKALLWMASSCTSGGSVRSSVALQTVSIVLRMTHSTLQRMADSQAVRQTDSTVQTD